MYVFDDGCEQYWKSFWTVCNNPGNQEFNFTSTGAAVGVGYDTFTQQILTNKIVCERNYSADRCSRQIIAVVGTLIMEKMAIAAILQSGLEHINLH